MKDFAKFYWLWNASIAFQEHFENKTDKRSGAKTTGKFLNIL